MEPGILPESDSWVKALRVCQDEVAASDPHPHYLAAYRREEERYWTHVPRWVYEESNRRAPRRVLDVGCAYGTLLLFARRLSGCDAYATDFIDAFLSPTLAAKAGIRFRVSNIELDPLPWEGTFDMILFTEVLEHLNFHPVPTLRKLANALGGRGTMYLSTPDASQWGRVTQYYAGYRDMPPPSEALRSRVVDDHVWQYDEAELREVLAEAGLRVAAFDYAPGATGRRHFNLALKRQ